MMVLTTTRIRKQRAQKMPSQKQKRQRNHHRTSIIVVFFFLLSTITTTIILRDVNAEVHDNGKCNLFSFVPFTNNGSSTYELGMVHMTAALLAIEHFNTRNNSVVPQLANLTYGCPYYFYGNDDVHININDTTVYESDSSNYNNMVFDTGTVTHLASRLLAGESPNIPCAIAGPFNDVPALDLSTMAQAYQYPLVANRAYNMRVLWEFYSPYSNQVYPNLLETSEYLVSFLKHKGRTNYTSILYDASDAGVQRRDALSTILTNSNFSYYEQRYVAPSQPVGFADVEGTENLRNALSNVKERGYRTIIVTMFNPAIDVPVIADVAVDLGLTNGEYFWVWLSQLDSAAWTLAENKNVVKLLAGSAVVAPIERYRYEDGKDTDPFVMALKGKGAELFERTKEEVVKAAPFPEQYDAEPQKQDGKIIEVQEAVPGTGFMYDAVLTVGIGMCLADRPSNTETSSLRLSGRAHLEGIRRANFMGVSGQVSFYNTSNIDSPGSRTSGTVAWGAYNLYPPNNNKENGTTGSSNNSSTTMMGKIYSTDPNSEYHVLTDIYLPGDPLGWQLVQGVKFIYADGGTIPPPLRNEPEMHYLNDGLQIFGLFLYGEVIFVAIVTVTWVFLYRKNAVLMAAQPMFLYLIAFGSVVFASAIFSISFDEEDGWTTDQLSSACMSVPWLVCLGHIATYSALFSKLWRVDQVLQFTRRRIRMYQILWPSIVLFAISIAILGLWTGLQPLVWERTIINEYTGESMGRCVSSNSLAYAISITVLMLITSIITCFMAWKTKDVDGRYAESFWIFTLILVQLQAILVVIPLIAILTNLHSTTGRYIGSVILYWIFPTSTLALIMVPKAIAFYKDVRGIKEPKRKRGERAKISTSGVVSGLEGQGRPAGKGSSGPSTGPSSGVNEGTQTSPLPVLATGEPYTNGLQPTTQQAEGLVTAEVSSIGLGHPSDGDGDAPHNNTNGNLSPVVNDPLR